MPEIWPKVIFFVCVCVRGIMLDMILYTSTSIDIPEKDTLGFSRVVVKTMMEPYLGKGHVLYTDKWYTSPDLCQYLFDNNTGHVAQLD